MATRGLVLLAKDTFTSVSSVQFDNVFSATYKQYKIIVNALGSTTTTSLNFRLRVGGSDNSSTNYQRQLITGNNTTVSAARLTSETSWVAFAGAVKSTEKNIVVCEVLNPFQTTYTSGTRSNQYETSGNIELQVGAFGITVTTSYDGFTILPGSGTITGTITVYGLAE
jgi:23S rRNA-/tRNA-specific pseudouridylate synthase